MTLNIQNTSSITQPWLHTFFYGDTGTGKTSAAATFPSPLFLVPASEGSELTLAGRDVDFIKLGRDHQDRHIDVREHMTKVLCDLEDRHVRLLKGDDDALPWETIVVESLTHYCDMLVASIGEDGRKQMDMQKWGLVSTHLTQMQARLRRLPCHVVYTALAKLSDGEGKTQVGMPSVQGSQAIKMPTSCDIIGYTEELPPTRGADQSTFRIHFRKHGPYMARARFRNFPPFVDNFHFDQIAPLCGLAPVGA